MAVNEQGENAQSVLQHNYLGNLSEYKTTASKSLLQICKRPRDLNHEALLIITDQVKSINRPDI